MTKNLTKMLFLFSLFMGTMISISSNSWFGVWMGLEMNLLSFIPLMNDKNLMINESSIKYFIVQAMASTMLLFSILVILLKYPLDWGEKTIPSMMISSSLMLKIGATPFHMWFPEVMKALSWINCLILMTWQKLAPIQVMSYCMQFNLFYLLIIISSTVIGAIGGLNQTSLRKIMAYSSINHIGWMLSAMLISETMWEIYFVIYSMMSVILTTMFNQSKLFSLNQVFISSNTKTEMKFNLFISLLSLGGLPPLLGFLPKWIVIQTMVENKLSFVLSVMLMMSMITLYYYMKIGFSSLIILNNELTWSMSIKPKKFNFMVPMTTMISSLGLILTTSLIYTS
uniref:NADH-ubiquinone oxidoreductase chain 2 n=1 Tax=Algete brunneri TaxID=1634111 RepID=A0A516IMY6_9ORTH|nr:NADH dehydrogenase subunit 2 [Algete brunneri]